VHCCQSSQRTNISLCTGRHVDGKAANVGKLRPSQESIAMEWYWMGNTKEMNKSLCQEIKSSTSPWTTCVPPHMPMNQ
jgi:hypothetical protein